MIRVHVICEGQTEEMFVNEVLSGPLVRKGIDVRPSKVGRPGHKGGNIQYERLLFDIRSRLLGDRSSYCTTFFDYYRLPGNFPGKAEAENRADVLGKSACILDAFHRELKTGLGEDPVRRFIPYVQMYEFEGLLFSDAAAFARGIGRNELELPFRTIRERFESPEEINDGPETAPSKRIKELFPEYDKPISGSLASLEVGIDAIRRECRLFNEWVSRLEALTPS